MSNKKDRLFKRRQMRVRYRLRQCSRGRVRLSVHRSNRNIAAQLIDDREGHTLAAASSLESELGIGRGSNREAAKRVGEQIAKRAVDAGISECYLDRGGYLFHGRVKALADAARAGGLKF
ncbi:MAG: 50S ribosomal protein L18 [Rhodobacteraceae bacterium]|nr:50S ribosomal protein L18 [Paracoccaceae bacterium]